LHGKGFPDGAGQLPLINLFNDFRTLAGLLLTVSERDSALNAYLVAAGMNQIVEDYLHRDPLSLGLVGTHLKRVLPRPLGWLGSTAAGSSANVVLLARNQYPTRVRIRAWQAELLNLVMSLAEAIASSPSKPSLPPRLRAHTDGLLQLVGSLPSSLHHDIVRLPSCFRSFDQQPGDQERLAQRFAEKFTDTRRDLVVLGLRTSGSYLAPILAAFLKQCGYASVRVLTYRPGQRWLRDEAIALRRAASAGAHVLVCDDPPISGRSVSRAGYELELFGFQPQRIVLMLQLFQAGTIPPRLHRWSAVSLPWEDWSIHDRLCSEAVQEALARMRPGSRIDHVTLLEGPTAKPRGHVHAVYRIRFGGKEVPAREGYLYVKGVGLGYFGEHAIAIADRLKEFVPETYGLEDGVIYREWILEPRRLTALPRLGSTVIDSIVDYVGARRDALAVDQDFSLRLPDRGAVWQRVAELLGGGFGRSAQFARPVLHRLAKRLVKASQPAVIDGAMELRHWFQAGSAVPSNLRKVEYEERAFSNQELYCYDPVFDLAGAAISIDDADLAEGLRRRFEKPGERIEPERWLLHQLVHLDELERRGDEEPLALQRAKARAVQRYVSEVWFYDLPLQSEGPICAIDVDGVLETTGLGFSAIGPTGARALRGLIRHGYRPIIVTGRSLDEVRGRCIAYRLAGGVAEYGAAVYNPATDTTRRLLTRDQLEDMHRVRLALADHAEVLVDGSYQLAVRAYRVLGRERRHLTAEIIRTVQEAVGAGRVHAIQGSYQTDFMVVGVDKGTGLKNFINELGAVPPIELAVGDTTADIPMFELAARAFAPAHAGRRLPSRVRVLSKPYQAGFGLAVAALLGHAAGSCDLCRAPALSANARLLMDALAAHDSGRLARYRQVALLAWDLSTGRSQSAG